MGDLIVYRPPVEGQRKCPPKCSAKMSLGYAAMVSDDGVVDAMRTCRVGGLSASRYLLTVAPVDTQLPCYSSDGHTPALRLLYCLPACLLEKGRLPRRNGLPCRLCSRGWQPGHERFLRHSVCRVGRGSSPKAWPDGQDRNGGWQRADMIRCRFA